MYRILMTGCLIDELIGFTYHLVPRCPVLGLVLGFAAQHLINVLVFANEFMVQGQLQHLWQNLLRSLLVFPKVATIFVQGHSRDVLLDILLEFFA